MILLIVNRCSLNFLLSDKDKLNRQTKRVTEVLVTSLMFIKLEGLPDLIKNEVGFPFTLYVS